ncbi:MAG: DUF4147 domain-containing protein [Smithellaceae bacterium]|nr:DUF4147 domain-containing protein [Smithellaceae bacterium]
MARRDLALKIFSSALEAATPEAFINDAVRCRGFRLDIGDKSYDLHRYRAVHILGSGKASLRMARALLPTLPDRLSGGIVISNYDGSLEGIDVVVSAHPLPDERSMRAAERIMAYLQGLGEDDLFIYLLSGGSSSLLEMPLPGITMHDLDVAFELMLRGGLTIGQMNCVRKHLSAAKGGRLARATKARGIILVISDVIGDDLEVIGSAPFHHDSSTYGDAYEILQNGDIWPQMPVAVRNVITKGKEGEIEETPKKPSPHIDHFIIGSNAILLEKAKETAEASGIKGYVITSTMSGEARKTAEEIIRMGERIVGGQTQYILPACLLFGGETTVDVKGTGQGGRNQEMCLAALRQINGNDRFVFLCAGTDGIDGNSAAAGAVVDSESLRKAVELGLKPDEYLESNDSYNFFRQTDDLIVTGPTGTNLMDVCLLLVAPPS